MDKVTEDSYGSSDYEIDSDSDGLGDYEEIYYWFSDPMSDNTDGDGFKDGAEVVRVIARLAVVSLPVCLSAPIHIQKAR